MDFIRSTSSQEFANLIRHFTAGIEPEITFGRTRFSEASQKAFKHVNDEEMLMLSMIESTIYFRNRAARNISQLLFKPQPLLAIVLEDIQTPDNSRNYMVNDDSVTVHVVQNGQKPRHVVESDISVLNDALTRIVYSNGE